jgi:hypothetical protein
MEDIFEREDIIARLVREEGLLTTSAGFTDKVMNLVNESTQKSKIIYQPLLSRKAWISIMVSFITMVLVSFYVVLSGKTGEVINFGRLKPLADQIRAFHIPLNVNAHSLMLTTLILASIGLLLLLDNLLNSRFRESFK